MSLSARIAVRGSRRLEAIAGCIAVGGIAVAAFAAASRWPAASEFLLSAAVVAAIAVAVRCVRAARAMSGYVLSVSDRAEIAVSPDPESGDDESWRLDESTMMTPGFSVIGLRRGSDVRQGGRSMRLAVFDDESRPADRRALHRFLLWSLRGGATRDASSRGGRLHP